MSYLGHVQNGVVVLDGQAVLPEGATVVVTMPASAPRHVRRRVDFPLVGAGERGSLTLTNERIAELLDEEDAAP